MEERDWAELYELRRFLVQGKENMERYKRLSAPGRMQYDDQRSRKIIALAEAFWKKYPDSPNRMLALEYFLGEDPWFIKQYPAESERLSDAEWQRLFYLAPRDVDARAEWESKGWDMVGAVLASPDASQADKELADWALFCRDSRSRLLALNFSRDRSRFVFGRSEAFIQEYQGRIADMFYAVMRPRFDAHAIKYADLPIMAERAEAYVSVLDRTHSPDTVAAGLRHLLESPGVTDVDGLLADKAGIVALRKSAAERLGMLEVIAGFKPVEMKFTAFDGREVDVAQLRGKVVIIDFWAMWCPSCVAELSNLKRLYEQYHDRGLEIIGISFDEEGQKDALSKFLTKHNVAWPQRFEGKGLEADRYKQLYGIIGLPTIYVLNREGRVVDDNARGKGLEALVRHYLELDAP